jgi:arylsulfatase A-like enzyme
MGSPEDLRRAGADPESYVRYSKDWYDGSIRAMDTEIGRLLERLRGSGLEGRSVLAFYADHGEEFHDHGHMAHGHSLYGEMIRVPLILWGPGRVPGPRRPEETAQLIDVMPTLLDLAGLGAPRGVQGQSLLPLLVRASPGTVAAAGGWGARPAIAEKEPMGSGDAVEAYTIVDGGWKLIHNVAPAGAKPEFELYRFEEDPLDQSDQAARHPEVVKALSARLEQWHRAALAARLKPDGEAAAGYSREELERLRSLGYLN